MEMTIDKIIGNKGGDFWKGLGQTDDRVYIKTPNARSILARGIKHFVGEKAVWLEEYEKVAEWLEDNKGKGLLCAGSCGRGKTVITQKVLPLIFNICHRKIMNVITSTALNERYDEFSKNKIISIDDVGIESVANIYGEKRHFVQEIIDEAERKQKLLVISTNLNEKELIEKYDYRTVDRLRTLTSLVIFQGESLRG